MKLYLKKGREDLAKFIVFLLNPIIGLLYSLKRINTRGSMVVIFSFFLLFGLSFTVDSVLFSDDATRQYLDGMSHRATFELYAGMTWSDFISSLKGAFIGEGERDFYAPTIKFLVSRVSDNYHLFFLVISLVFSFFCLKSFEYLVKDPAYDNSWIAYALAYMFLLIQIFQINGVRFYTAAWIAIYSLFKIYVDYDRKYLILLLLTPLVHRAFLFLYIVLVIKYFFGKYNQLWIGLFFLSFFLSELISSVLSTNLHLLPDFLAEWAGYYVEQEAHFGGGGIFYDLSSLLVRIYRNLLIILIIQKQNIVKSNIKTRALYSFLIVMATCSNLVMPISNLGSRFSMLLWPLIAYIWLLNMKGKYTYVMYMMPVVFFYKAFYYDPQMYATVLEPCFYYYPSIFLVFKYLFI